MTSLDSLKYSRLLVSFGNASGPVVGVELGILASKGSLYVRWAATSAPRPRSETTAAVLTWYNPAR